MLVIGLFGLLEKIIEWIGPVITSGMMAGVGLTLTKVAWDMAKGDKAVGITSFASGLIVYMATVDLVYTITVSVLLPSAAAYMINKRKGMTQQPVQRERITRQRLILNPTVIRGAFAMVCLNIGANIAFGKINGEIASHPVNVDVLTVISSLADMVSSFFGGAPVEVIISATASAPHAVWSGVLMMVLMAMILLAGWLPKIGRYIPSASITGFLFVLGAIVTLPGNAAAALTTGEPTGGLVGAITMAVTALTDPFIGMLAGVILEFLINIF